jgi:hypothetical protein
MNYSLGIEFDDLAIPLEGDVLFADHYAPVRAPWTRVVAFFDDPAAIARVAERERFEEFVYPHYGHHDALDQASLPAGVFGHWGPAYMPLRPDFADPPTVPGSPHVLNYALMRDRGQELLTAEKLSGYAGVVSPPSTIAYEALAVGTRLWVSDELPEYAHIADAMIGAEVAEYADEYPRYAIEQRRHIDGLGAKRLLEAVLT